MSTSVISPRATIGPDTTIGQFCVIEDDVVIGRNCKIEHNVVLRCGTIIGNDVWISDRATLGQQPMRAFNSTLPETTELTPARVGARCRIGVGAIIYAGCTLAENVFVADLATIREAVAVGACTIVGRGVAIENACSIGQYCKLETNAYITAYSHLEDRAFVAPGVLTSNDNFAGRTPDRHKYYKGVTVRRGGRLGVGAVILPGKEIGADALVAGGAVLTHDATPGDLWAGVPARAIRRVSAEQLLENQGWRDISTDDLQP